ncbi:GNAT family N-acetyltransferase [Vibrio sp. LaRot3]|uniref:GNAT family N-acetyltransferase n=1 Tax=Vibrio sp. LaRot3 TaxID=2998829 RepID=UPI0022CDD9F5|nr:GNAT family N-acetyltransferase [Vibrio sp. LaRot3]MDA0147781.1 GNAT family N-acetyltransferase [Vibrio sp. LaRot3]
MIAIKQAKLKDFANLMEIEVLPDQKEWHIPFETAYHDRSKLEVILTLFSGKQAIGYLVLDKAFAHYATFAERHELGLKYFVIDKNHQRKGYGKQALQKLFVYAYAVSPDSNSVCVTIPVKNKPAYDFFIAAGFVDSEKFYRGDNGKEWILHHKL